VLIHTPPLPPRASAHTTSAKPDAATDSAGGGTLRDPIPQTTSGVSHPEAGPNRFDPIS